MRRYTPAETAARTGFSIETLRYYERIGLIGDVGRDAGGRRVFSDEHLDWLGVLRCLRDTGMPIATMRRYAALALNDGLASASVSERLTILRQHAAEVADRIALLRQQQQHLHEKIAYYEQVTDQLLQNSA